MVVPHPACRLSPSSVHRACVFLSRIAPSYPLPARVPSLGMVSPPPLYRSFLHHRRHHLASKVPAAKLLPVPDAVPLDVATALVVQGMTAHYLTSSAHAGLIKEGEWCLIHGTGGGTCQWAAQMAKIQGYKVRGGFCGEGVEGLEAPGCFSVHVRVDCAGCATKAASASPPRPTGVLPPEETGGGGRAAKLVSSPLEFPK